MSYLAILVLLSLLIVIHEAGHLAAARLAGIPVASFAVPRFTRLREPLTVLGIVVLAAVMIYANVRDVVRIWG